MAIVTYGCRAGGYWLMGRVTISPRIEIGLTYLPGAVLISLVAPAMAEEGIPGVCAVAATALAMRLTNSLLVAMVAGVGTVWLMRQLI
ncbi:MAG: AzlD domain-containing protein [Chloroflexia bacterium]|nr:AzlD domain-containing protein [Chloroflexia bacterium]